MSVIHTGSKESAALDASSSAIKADASDLCSGLACQVADDLGDREETRDRPPTCHRMWDVLQVYSYRAWCRSLCTMALNSRTPFSVFLRTTLSASSSSTSVPASTLFPLPIPRYGLFEVGQTLNGDKRRRKQEHQAFHVFVMALNFLYFDYSFVPLDLLCRAPNANQGACLERLWSIFRVFGHGQDEFKVPTSGRRSTTLISLLSDLSDFVTQKGIGGDCYSKSFAGFPEEGVIIDHDINKAPELRPYRSLDPTRLALHGEALWDPAPFLPDFLWMPYHEPSVLLAEDYDNQVPLPDLDREVPEDVLKLAKVWDARGLLFLRHEPVTAEEKSSCLRIFNCYKDAQVDRQIADRRGRNIREGRVFGDSNGLPSGVALSVLELDP